MTIEEKANQCAFPADARTMTDGGMTLREYFAAKAMQGYCGGEYTGQSGMPVESIAKWSVEMADALLSALAEKK